MVPSRKNIPATTLVQCGRVTGQRSLEGVKRWGTSLSTRPCRLDTTRDSTGSLGCRECPWCDSRYGYRGISCSLRNARLSSANFGWRSPASHCVCKRRGWVTVTSCRIDLRGSLTYQTWHPKAQGNKEHCRMLDLITTAEDVSIMRSTPNRNPRLSDNLPQTVVRFLSALRVHAATYNHSSNACPYIIRNDAPGGLEDVNTNQTLWQLPKPFVSELMEHFTEHKYLMGGHPHPGFGWQL